MGKHRKHWQRSGAGCFMRLDRQMTANRHKPVSFVFIFSGNQDMGDISRKNGRSGGIRTHDPLTPSQVRYRAALRSEPRKAI